jgi:hypothetical protein
MRKWKTKNTTLLEEKFEDTKRGNQNPYVEEERNSSKNPIEKS